MGTTSPAQREANPGGLFCGVDVGASATKVVLLDSEGEVQARVVRSSGVDYEATSRQCLAEALDGAGAPGAEVAFTVSTGYGRRNVTFAGKAITELHCHGAGCHHLVPRAITVVDIGGQDNKVINLAADGKRLDFRMNRKCAAGTGAFIEEIAARLDVDLGEMDALAREAAEAVRLSSFCTVFAKTEILSHLRQGVPVSSIVRGAFLSVVVRVMEMAPLSGEVVLTGGVVAHNPTVGEILADKLGHPVTVPPYPQFTGALGAALMAIKEHQKGETANG